MSECWLFDYLLECSYNALIVGQAAALVRYVETVGLCQLIHLAEQESGAVKLTGTLKSEKLVTLQVSHCLPFLDQSHQ